MKTTQSFSYLHLGFCSLIAALTLANQVMAANNSLQADFVSQLLPSNVTPGETFKVIVQYRNTGETTWRASNKDMTLQAISKETQRLWSMNPTTLDKNNNVAPGDVATFTLMATAPNKAGQFDIQLGLKHNSAGQVGNATPLTFIDVNTQINMNDSLKKDAEFVSVHVDEDMVTGGEYEVVVIYKNTGASTWWSGNTKLTSQTPLDNLVWFINQVDYGETTTTQPQDIHAFRFSVRAPEEPGRYNFQWQLLDTQKNEVFGEISEKTLINVIAR